MIGVAVALAGGAGAAGRLVLDGEIRTRTSLPVATLVVNVLGSFLIGVVVGLEPLSPGWRLVLGTGALGGFTTFSTASTDTVRLLADGRPCRAWLMTTAMVVLAVGAVVVGLLLAR